MAFTDHSQLFAAVHVDGLNRIFAHLRPQRPSLFNYGTQWFADNPWSMTIPLVDIAPEVLRCDNPIITIEEPIALFGTDGRYGLDFYYQLSELYLGFTDGGINLHLQVCGGIACPDIENAMQIANTLEHSVLPRRITDGDEPQPQVPRPAPTPIRTSNIDQFCLNVDMTVNFEQNWNGNTPTQGLILEDFQLSDIYPEGLSDGVNCYVRTSLIVGVLPKIRIALDSLLLKIGDSTNLTIAPTPYLKVRNNPSIDDEEIKVFADIVDIRHSP